MNKRLSNKEYMKRFKNLNPNMEMLETYSTQDDKIIVRCITCKSEYNHQARVYLNGKFVCKTCKSNKKHDDFVKRLNKINKNIKVISKYIKYSEKVEVMCSVCGNKWKAVVGNLLKGIGCRECHYSNIRWDKNKYIKEVAKVNKNVIILSDYVNAKTKVKVKCLIDNHEWEVLATFLLQGSGCPLCGGSIKRSHEQFIIELKEKNPNIEVMSEYINCDSKVKVKCLIDNHEWETLARVKKIKCPICSIKERSKSHEQFISEIYEVNKSIKILGVYKNNYTGIKTMCLIHKNIWYPQPVKLLSGSGCPICRASKGEKEISRVLDKLNIKYIKEFKPKWANGRRYDFLIFNKILIEYDGIQHFKEVNKGWSILSLGEIKKIDLFKNKLSKDNNFKLLRISYSEINNIEKILNKVILDSNCFSEKDFIFIGKEYKEITNEYKIK